MNWKKGEKCFKEGKVLTLQNLLANIYKEWGGLCTFKIHWKVKRLFMRYRERIRCEWKRERERGGDIVRKRKIGAVYEKNSLLKDKKS